MISRREILAKAIDDCIIEAFKWAQPSINLREYIDGTKKVEETRDDRFYERYYLSHDNFKYIAESYLAAYHIGKDWTDDINLLVNYITSKDSVKDKYIEREGNQPGYRGYEPIVPLQEIIKDHEAVLDLIDTCKNFYCRDFERERFNFSVYLGCSPTTNAEVVEKYWREHGRPDFKVKEFNIVDIIYPEDEDIDEDSFIESLK